MQKVKKLVLSLAVLAGLGFSASAQNNPVKFGVKAGVAFSNVSFSSSGLNVSGDTRTSFYIGGTVDLPVSELFSVQPGLSYIGKGTKQKVSGSVTMNGQTTSVTAEETLSPGYLEIPVNLIANFKAGEGKFFVGAGPYYAFGIAGKIKGKQTTTSGGNTSTVTEDEKIKFGSGSDAHLKRGDFGVNVLAGYQLKSGLSFNAGYGLGLSNIVNSGQDGKAKNRVFTVGLGFAF
eukprot:gene12763-15606_t